MAKMTLMSLWAVANNAFLKGNSSLILFWKYRLKGPSMRIAQKVIR